MASQIFWIPFKDNKVDVHGLVQLIQVCLSRKLLSKVEDGFTNILDLILQVQVYIWLP